MRLLSCRTFAPVLGFLSQESLSVSSFRPIHQRGVSSRLCMSSSVDNNSSSKNNGSNVDGVVKKGPVVIVQYIFLRRDLDWPAGAMAAQAAHASVAAITQGLAQQDEATAAYVSVENLPRMTKMVYGVDTVEQLEQVRDAWNALVRSIQDNESKEGDCLHAYWWVEQPENIPSAMATWPILRTNKVSKVIKNLKLSYF